MTTQAQQRAASARFYGFCLSCGGPKDKPPAKEPSSKTARPPRTELVELVRVLRGEGWTHRRVATQLCISESYAEQLANDPDGAKARARRDRYRGTCQSCGAKTDGSNGPASAPKFCHHCVPHPRHWTRAEILRTFREFEKVMGRPPAASDAMIAGGHAPSLRAKLSEERIAEADKAHALGVRLPRPGTVVHEFGGWPAALRAAGMPLNASGGRGHRDGHYPRTAQDDGAPSTRAEVYRAFRRGDFVCPSCGDFTTVLYETTGWCGACTKTEAAA